MGGYFAVSFFLIRSIHDLHQLKKASLPLRDSLVMNVKLDST